MTILSLDTQRDIRNAALSALHFIAFDQKCEVADILTILNSRDTAAPSDHPAKPTGPEAKHAAEEPFANGSGGMHGRCEPIPPSQSEIAPDSAQAGEPRNFPAPNPVDAAGPADAVDAITEPAPSRGRALPGGLDRSGSAPDVAGEAPRPQDASPAPIKRRDRLSVILACHRANPGWTGVQIATHLGLSPSTVSSALSRAGISLKAARRAADAAEPPSGQSATTEPAPAVTEHGIGREAADQAEKRQRVAMLHKQKPHLSPYDAAAQLNMPVVNLRIFTKELGIAWSAETAAEQPPLREPSASILARVRKRHEQKPNWPAGMLAKELGLPRDMAQAALDIIKAETSA